MKNFDIYQEVTNRIIAQLEKGVIPWEQPWKVSAVRIGGKIDLSKIAFNRVTKTPYSLLNQMLLGKPGEYASFKQWTELGGKIKRGAKAQFVVFWKQLDVEDKNDIDENGNPKHKRLPFLRYMQVFHISDVEGVKPLKLAAENEEPTHEIIKTFNPDEEAENVLNSYLEREQINIRYGGNRAYYSPSSDSIQLPDRISFGDNSAEFYSTAFHEVGHSTGAKHRLDRLTPSFFGSHEYSKEELVAEISASAMLSILNLETAKSFRNSVAYIQSWIKVLKSDKKFIVSATSKAEKAIDYIFNGKETEAA